MKEFLELTVVLLISLVVYYGLSYLVSGIINGGFNDDTNTAIGAWVVGGFIFIGIVLLWATTPCPFLIR